MASGNRWGVVRVAGAIDGSGTILAPQLVLTCRHVVDAYEHDQFGDASRPENLTAGGLPVVSVFRSPKNSSANLSDGSDLALLLLARPLRARPVRLLLGPIASETLRDDCMGWGFAGTRRRLVSTRLKPQFDGLLDEDHIGLAQSTISAGMSGGPILTGGGRDCLGILTQGRIGRAASVACGTKLIVALLRRADVAKALAAAGIAVEHEHLLRREVLAYIENLRAEARQPSGLFPDDPNRHAAVTAVLARICEKADFRRQNGPSQSGVVAISSPPGFGKSRLLHEQVLRAARMIVDEMAADPGTAAFPPAGEVPLFLTARDLEGAPNQTMDERIACRLNFLFAQQPALQLFLAARLRNGRSLVAIDDWDTSSDALRDSLAAWAPNPMRRTVLAQTGKTSVPPGTESFNIAPLGPTEMREFVEAWTGDSGRTASFLQFIGGWKEAPLADAPRIPLLLALLCRLYDASPTGTLPADPPDLFRLLDRVLSETHDPAQQAALRAQLKKCWETLFPAAPSAPAAPFASGFAWQHVQAYKQGKRSRSDASLLVAANEAVPFIGREDLLGTLVAWAVSSKPIAIRVITGQGGSGKTRLALELANRLSKMGWNCFWAKASQGQTVASTPLTGPALLVFDYASSFANALRSALGDLLDYQPDYPLRILLLDRLMSGWYQDLLPEGGSRYGVTELFDSEPLELPPYDSRRGLFQAGINAWAHRHGRTPLMCPEPGVVRGFDQGLGSPVGADPLYLLIAAFVAAEHERFEPALEKTRLDLVEYAARKEWDELQRRANNRAGLVTELATINTLAGGCSIEVAETLAQRKLGLGRSPSEAFAAVDILDDIYGDDRGGLQPIQPDPVAEAYVLLYWHRRQNKQRFIDQCLGDAARATDPAVVAAFLVRTGQTFGWIQSPSQVSSDEGSLRVEVALDALERFLTVRQDLGGPERVVNLLPSSTETVALRALRLRVARSYRKIFPADAGLILTEADALASMQRHGEAVELLSQMSPMFSEHQRAHALEIRANSWSAQGQREPAIRDLEEAAILRGRSGEHLGDLASVLSNLANRLSECGHLDKAESHSRRSVEIYRRLAAESRGLFADQLGRALCSRAAILHDLFRKQEAIQTLREGLDLFEELARDNKDRYQPQLGTALINAALFWAADGQLAAALEASEKAVGIFQDLDARLPGVFLEQLALAVRALSTRLRNIGRRKAAEKAAVEAVEIHARLAASRPSKFQAELAVSLRTLAATQDSAAAVESLNRAVELLRPLVREDPRAFEPELSQTLSALAGDLTQLDRNADAARRAEEAVAIDRRLEASSAFRIQLAHSLRILAIALWDGEQLERALAAIEESVRIRRELGEVQGPSREFLARSLDLQAKLQDRLGRSRKAMESSRESLDIMQSLAQSSAAYHPGLALALNGHAARLLNAGDWEGALEHAMKSIPLTVALVPQNPRLYCGRLAAAIGLAAEAQMAGGRLREARACFAEGAKLLLPFVREDAQAMNLVATLATNYIKVRAKLADPLAAPITDESLTHELFSEPPLQLNGYIRPEL